LTEIIIDFVRKLIGDDALTTVLISMIPIVELRGAIPAAMTMGLQPIVAFALAWAGSAIVSPILLLILRPVLNWMKKCKVFASLANAVEGGFKSKAMKVVGAGGLGELTAEQVKKLERRKMLGVFLFVAFPIPLTGVWTGSAVATFLDIPFFKSMLMVWLGNLLAGAIVTVLAVFLKAYMNVVLDVFFVIVILVLAVYIIRTVVKMVKNKKNAALQSEQADGVGAEDSDTANAEESCVVYDEGAQEQEKPAQDESVLAKPAEIGDKEDNHEVL